MTPEQLVALTEIERQIALMRALEPPLVVPPTVIQSPANLVNAIATAPDGAIIDLGGNLYSGPIELTRPITIRNGALQAPPNTNDIIIITGDRVTLLDLVITGDGTTKRGIAANGTNMLFERIQVRNIRRAAQESNAVAIWNSPGPLTVRDSVLEGASQSFLAGGSSPTVPNTIPTGLTFERVTFTRPLEWRNQGFAVKTIFELKSARNVVVRDCILENMWSGEGQNGIAISLHPSQYGNSPENIVENVVFEDNIIRNVGGGASLLGFSQHQNEPGRATLRGNRYYFRRNTWAIDKTLYGGQGALITLDWEPDTVVWEDNVVTTNGDAFIRLSNLRPTTNFAFRRNEVNRTGTYGIYAADGNYRGVGWSTYFPGGEMVENTFTNAHSTFRTNFPTNTYVTVI